MRWYFPVTDGICSGLGTLFGGCGLGAAIDVLEQTTGRPVVWACAQYLNFTKPPSVVDLDVHILAEGRTTTQARVTGQVGDTPIFSVNASLGSRDGGFLLIGRRHLRSNNSWLHNLPALSGGSNLCTLQIHPDDAARLGVTDLAVVTGPGGKLEVPVEITDAIRPGVVSLPHGWGHSAPGTRMSVAAQHPGVNVNSLFDDSLLDPLSGNAVLNAVPVEVAAAG